MSQNQMTPLTEKDLAYMKDAMSWEIVATKKAFQYAHQTLEPECRQVMFQVAESHQRNYERILQHMSGHIQQTAQAQVAGAQPMASHM